MRVPFLLTWPERFPGGQVYSPPVTALDLMATFTAAAGAPRQTEDSVDLAPYLAGEKAGRPHEYLFWRSRPTLAIRGARYKLIKLALSDLRPSDLRPDGRLQPPQGGWPTEPEHGYLTLLYDLDVDRGETRNVAAEHPEVVARLEAALAEWNEGLLETPILPAIRSTLIEVDGEWVQLIF